VRALLQAGKNNNGLFEVVAPGASDGRGPGVNSARVHPAVRAWTDIPQFASGKNLQVPAAIGGGIVRSEFEEQQMAADDILAPPVMGVR
jgi:hypothetical protein